MMTTQEKVQEFEQSYTFGYGLTYIEQRALNDLCFLLYRTVKKNMPTKDTIDTIMSLIAFNNEYFDKCLHTRLVIAAASYSPNDNSDIDKHGCENVPDIIEGIKELINKNLPF